MLIDHLSSEVLPYTFEPRKHFITQKLKNLLSRFSIHLYFTGGLTIYQTFLEEEKHFIGKYHAQKIECFFLTLRT